MELEQITALDLLHAMIRQAPEEHSRLMGEALAGYLDAFNARGLASDTLAYKRGYFLCNRSPLTLGERMAEILGLQSLMILLRADVDLGTAITERVSKGQV